MDTNALAEVADKVKQAKTLDLDLLAQSIAAMEQAFPKEDFTDAERLMTLDPTEAVLHLVEEHLPEWTITLKGRADEIDGEWHCLLRKTDMHDNDSVIGVGTGPTLALAVLEAVLKASIMRANVSA